MNNIQITITRKVYDEENNPTPRIHAILYCQSFTYSDWSGDSWWKALHLDVNRPDKGCVEHYDYRLDNDDTFEVATV